MSKGSLEQIKKKFPEIKDAVKKCNYEVTPGDVSVNTGLPILEVEYALKQLVDDYFGGLKVSNDGDLVYFFPTKFNKNRYGGSQKFKQFMKSLLKGLYKIFKFLYKISIMVILIAYFLLFLILLIALVVMSTANRNGDNEGGGRSRGRNGGGGFGLSRILFWMWMGRSSGRNCGSYYRGRGGEVPYSRRQRRSESRYSRGEEESAPNIEEEEKKPFYKSVFDFVFGEDDPNEFLYKNMNRIVARFIQDKRGAVISEELTPITGTKMQSANTDVTKYVGKFESEPEVTDEGTVVLTFPKLLTSSQPVHVGGYHSEDAYYEELLKHNGNKTMANVIMCLLNAFNLVMSWLMLSGSARSIFRSVPSIALMIESHPIIFGAFPFVFSLLFFVIPIIRFFTLKSKNAKIRKRNLYKAVAIAVMRSDRIVRSSNLALPSESYDYVSSYSQADIESILNEMALSSCCNVDFENDGASRYYDFSDLHANLDEVMGYRTGNKVGRRITQSDIDFNSDDKFFDF